MSIASLLPDASGVPAVDTDGFPAEYRPFSLGHRLALDVIGVSGLRWAAASPAGDFGPDTSSVGGYALTEVGDPASRISRADHARALVDLAEQSDLPREHVGMLPLTPDEKASMVSGEGHR
ncbi:hypothetical protein ACWDSD_32685 [Streptomyces spiralis]